MLTQTVFQRSSPPLLGRAMNDDDERLRKKNAFAADARRAGLARWSAVPAAVGRCAFFPDIGLLVSAGSY
jgi:hypothetical protein